MFFIHQRKENLFNDFLSDQVKPLLNELLDYFDYFFIIYFQRDIKMLMKDAFEQNDVSLDEIKRQNNLLKDQLLEASLKHDIELCVLLNHECFYKSLHDKLEQVKKKSLEIQEGLKARIKILKKDVQRCEKQSVDFELKLQREKEKRKWDSSKNKNSKPLDFSWISRIQKLEDENVSLDFKVQSLIKERDNAKMEYKKLFDSMKNTRSQTQKETDELITHAFEKTYAYGVICAKNQNLLDTISELKDRMKNGENGMNATSSVKRPKSRDSHVKTSVLDVSKNEAKKEAVYVRKNKQTDNTFAKVVSNKENVIDVAVANASKAKTLLCVSCMQSVLIPCHDKCVAKHKLNVRSNARRTFSVNSRIPKSSETTFVAPKTRFSEKATQSKTLDTTSVASKSKIDEASASKARDKVSSAFKKKKRNMRDKPLSPFMLNKIRTSRLWQKWFESQPNVMWTPVNTKPHAHTNPSNTKPLVVQIVLWVVDSGCSKHMTGDRSLLRNFVEKFMGTVRFGNDNFAAITGYGDYIHGNITIFHVYYVEGLGHNLFSVGQFCNGDLEVGFRSNTCYVRNLEGDNLLTGERDLNLYTISISDMAASSLICLMSKATSTKSWLWHRRLSHLNFGTINDLTKLDLVDGLPKFKYGKDHLCSACERGKSKKASHPPKLIPSDYSKLELLHMDLCGPMRVASVNGKKYILVIVDDFSRFTWVYFLRSKDKTPKIIKKFIAQAQLNYKAKDPLGIADKEIDDSQFTYGPKQSKPSESDARSSDFNSCESNCSEETHESMLVPVVNEPKVVSEPKVWSDAPIIEEYESDSEDEHVSLPIKEQEIPSFAFINTVKHVKTPRQTVKEQNTCSQSPKPDKKDCSGLMSKKLGLGYGYTRKACFVCGSFSHLIKDCDYYEKKMAKQAELTNRVVKRTGQVIEKPVWNNARRVNHENKFVPRTVLINTGRSSVNTARPKVNTHAEPASTTKKISTLKNQKVLNSPCFMVKSWLVQDQTVLGKDYSNLLIADSLLKTIWFINAPCYGNEALVVQSKSCDAEEMRCKFKIESENPVSCVFATTTRDHPIHLWDPTTGQLRCTYRPYDNMDEITAAFSIGFNPTGTKIFAGYNKSIRIFDIHRPSRDFEQRSTIQGNKEGQSCWIEEHECLFIMWKLYTTEECALRGLKIRTSRGSILSYVKKKLLFKLYLL
ncbi:integrase, catalytic region, zinc finger, CCHC-type containing protein [Tanacetum coccineum]